MMLIITLVVLFSRIHRYIDVDDFCLNRAVVIHNTVQTITRAIRPLKLNIPILFYTLANLQYQQNDYKQLFFPINVSKELIKTALTEMSYRTNWINGTGRYNIKSLKHIKNTIRTDEVTRLATIIHSIFRKEISTASSNPPVEYNETSNKYKVEGYYDVIYSSYSKEICQNVKLALSTIITYSILNRDPAYCYNAIGWRPNIYKTFINQKSKYLDCFSSPIYPTIRPFCSIFPQDTFFEGCVGGFSLETLRRVAPNVLFCNPTIDPYTGNYCMNILDKYLKERDALVVLTTQCTFGKLPNYVDPSSAEHTIVASSVLDHCFRSPYTLGFFIVPLNISRSSLIYQNNTRLTKSSIEIETSYIVILYGKHPSPMSLKRLLADRLRQNCEPRIVFDNNGVRPNLSEIQKAKHEYGWSIDIFKEMNENIRLLRSYFDN